MEQKMVSRADFLGNAGYIKQQYEHLLVAGYPEGKDEYLIGVELGNDKILVVDSVTERNVRERLQNWAGQVENIRADYRCNYNPS
ncbi:MAG: hypothetical protein ACM3NT_03120 [Methylocystaceae bacterium]